MSHVANSFVVVVDMPCVETQLAFVLEASFRLTLRSALLRGPTGVVSFLTIGNACTGNMT